MASAISSLPVPVSPWINTMASVGATICTISRTSRRAALLPIIRGNPLLPTLLLSSATLADNESSASKDALWLTTGASATQHVCVAILYSFPYPLHSRRSLLPAWDSFFLPLILDRSAFLYIPRWKLRKTPRSRFLVVPLLGCLALTSRYGWVNHEGPRSGSTGPKSQFASGRIDARPRTMLQVRALLERRLKPRAGCASGDR